MTFDEFTDSVNEAHGGVIRDHPPGESGVVKYCHILHEDLAMDQTPLSEDHRHALSEQYEKTMGLKVEEFTGINFTQEHQALHKWLQAFRAQAAQVQMSLDELLAATLVIGRRMGLTEASQMFGSFNSDDLTMPPTEEPE